MCVSDKSCSVRGSSLSVSRRSVQCGAAIGMTRRDPCRACVHMRFLRPPGPRRARDGERDRLSGARARRPRRRGKPTDELPPFRNVESDSPHPSLLVPGHTSLAPVRTAESQQSADTTRAGELAGVTTPVRLTGAATKSLSSRIRVLSVICDCNVVVDRPLVESCPARRACVACL